MATQTATPPTNPDWESNPEHGFNYVKFDHHLAPNPLITPVGPNEITWGYGLNTSTTPTYGGEIVQVLSAYVDDLTIQGETKTYHQMEHIYRWFLRYFQASTTQGHFDNEPVFMSYPKRSWTLKIRPYQLPAFRYATDLTAPAWRIQAAVVEQSKEMAELTLQAASVQGFDFSKLNAGIGYDIDNPWTDPGAKNSKYDPQEYLGDVSDFYQNLIPSYLKGDFNSLLKGGFQVGSGPADPQQDSGSSQSGNSNQSDGNTGSPGSSPSNPVSPQNS